MIDLHERILDLSYKHKLSHLGSCLNAVDIIEDIYLRKLEDEPFILSSGHAGLALYVVLEKYLKLNAEKLYLKHGTHPCRNISDDIYCSTGSLGHGLPIALGMALANRYRNVWCLISDGECAEGSVYESLAIACDQKVKNLIIYCNANGYGAYRKIDLKTLKKRIEGFNFPVKIIEPIIKYDIPWLNGLEAHYHVMNEAEYNLVKGKLNATL